MSGLGVLCLLFLFFAKPVYSGQGVGKALEEALKSRASHPIEDVGQQFQIAIEQTNSPAQKAAILFFLADFLMEKQEWNQAIEVYERILREGTKLDKPCALYGEAQAYLMMGRTEEVSAICTDIKTNYPDNTIEQFANDMAVIAPGSVHAKLAAFFAAIPPSRPEESAIVATPLSEEAPTESQPASNIEKTKENRLAVGVKGWHSDLSGDIDSKGMNLGLSADTDIGARTELALNASWKLSKKDQLRLDYTQFNHKGSLNRAVTFDNLPYAAGSSVKLETSFFDVGFSRLLNESEHGSWKFLYGLKFSDLFMKLEQQLPTGPRSGELDQNFSVPYLGFEGNRRVSDSTTLIGAIKYFSFNQGGASGRLTDFDIALQFGRDYDKCPATNEWYGTLGYRFFMLHGNSDEDSSEINYSGPTLGLEIEVPV
jgi:hypothetical protein